MIVKIIKINEEYLTADVCYSANHADCKYNRSRFTVSWKNKHFQPKIGHSYSVMPKHEWIKLRRGVHLIHGVIDRESSMEDQLFENSTRKN